MTKVVTAVLFQAPEGATVETSPEETLRHKNGRERKLRGNANFAPPTVTQVTCRGRRPSLTMLTLWIFAPSWCALTRIQPP